ncbi:hypothetical protein D3C73_1102040 [compost metagenome]
MKRLRNPLPVASYDVQADATPLLLVENLQLGFKRTGMAFIAEGYLNLMRVRLQIIQILLNQHLAAMHNADMIAQILDLAQIMRGDQHRQAALGHLLE